MKFRTETYEVVFKVRGKLSSVSGLNPVQLYVMAVRI